MKYRLKQYFQEICLRFRDAYYSGSNEFSSDNLQYVIIR